MVFKDGEMEDSKERKDNWRGFWGRRSLDGVSNWCLHERVIFRESRDMPSIAEIAECPKQLLGIADWSEDEVELIPSHMSFPWWVGAREQWVTRAMEWEGGVWNDNIVFLAWESKVTVGFSWNLPTLWSGHSGFMVNSWRGLWPPTLLWDFPTAQIQANLLKYIQMFSPGWYD